MKGLPRCTVILPTYNRVATLPRAVASVIAQNEPDFELIIIDDGSTDKTREWLSKLDDPRIRVTVSDHDAAQEGVDTFLKSVMVKADEAGEPFGMSRLEALLRVNVAQGLSPLLGSVHAAVREHRGPFEAADDATMVALPLLPSRS